MMKLVLILSSTPFFFPLAITSLFSSHKISDSLPAGKDQRTFPFLTVPIFLVCIFFSLQLEVGSLLEKKRKQTCVGAMRYSITWQEKELTAVRPRPNVNMYTATFTQVPIDLSEQNRRYSLVWYFKFYTSNFAHTALGKKNPPERFNIFWHVFLQRTSWSVLVDIFQSFPTWGSNSM